MKKPIWKPVTRTPFSKCYEVSNDGRVRRIPGITSDGRAVRGGEMANVLVRGYHHVLMQCEGRKWMTRVHIVVALAFIGEPPGPIGVTGYTVNHKNFEKLDNRVENLEWMTARENHADCVAKGRKAHGERHYKARLTEAQVRVMRELRVGGFGVQAIADRMGLKNHLVSDVLLGRCWRHVT